MASEAELLDGLPALRVRAKRSGRLDWVGAGVIELWFPDGHSIARRRGLAAAFRRFATTFAGRLTHALPNDANRLVAFSQQVLDSFDELAETLPPDVYMDGQLIGPNDEGSVHDATPMAVSAGAVWNREPAALSSLTAYVPADWMTGDPTTAVDLVAGLASDLGAIQGSAGLGLARDFSSPPYSMYDDRAFPFLKRFPGLDYSDTPMFALATLDAPPAPRLRSVNWLTLLGPGHVEALGGPEALQSLEAEVVGAGPAGAVLVRSGARPGIGDLNEGRGVETYGPIARLTAPLRFEGYTSKGLFRVPSPLDEVEETLAWVRRFD